jgi:hypothetical protein
MGLSQAGPWEKRWRSFGALRELAFLRSDGFELPKAFPAMDPSLLQPDKRANLLFLYPPGRTHVSRALMQGPALKANLLIARSARVEGGKLLVDEAQFWHKGRRASARFTRPIAADWVAPFHGHPLYEEGTLEELGLPYSVQSLFHTWTTYDKAKYPAIFPKGSGVELPDEIDWLADWSKGLAEAEAKRQILEGREGFEGLKSFSKRHALIMLKDAAESGGRGQRAFDCSGDACVAVSEAVDFLYAISLRHNVAVQEIILSDPRTWATDAFLDSLVERQISDWGAAVSLKRAPLTPLYGSHRLILSSPDPRKGVWNASHALSLNSRQVITNVGRGGTLELFLPEFIRPEHRELLPRRLREAGAAAMRCLADYEAKGAQAYEAESGRKVGADATGLSYGTPRYMMLDFLVQPREGGDWRVVLIEPNIGIGLWDRVALREKALGRKEGGQAQIVLKDMIAAAWDYRRAKHA